MENTIKRKVPSFRSSQPKNAVEQVTFEIGPSISFKYFITDTIIYIFFEIVDPSKLQHIFYKTKSPNGKGFSK